MAKILLVDDEKVARLLYTDFLVGAGHAVDSAGTIEEAKAALAKADFDLLVTDLILPQGDGLELLQHAKWAQPAIEVVVITALDKVEPAVRAIKSGASDYLVKPITPETLAHAVNRALSQRALLAENESLRRHVALLEAGQRLATTIEQPALLEAAGATFTSHCGAAAVAIFSQGPDGLSVPSMTGVPELLDDEVAEQLTPAVVAALDGLDDHGQELSLPELPEAWQTAFLVPAREGGTTFGAVALLFADDISDDGAQAAAYLARHLAMGLRTAGRFSAVEDLVYLDDLTHLFNSRYLELVLEKEFKATQDKPFALLFLDLDYFKSVNDTHGHLIGSKLLVEVARVLKGCVRDNDIATRWGGDEYVILLRSTDSGGALKVAERIRRSVETHRFLAREGYGINITTCIGVASFPEHAQDKRTLLDFADRAMYRGKKGPRNIIYMAAKGLEATPASRHSPVPAPAPRPAAVPESTLTGDE